MASEVGQGHVYSTTWVIRYWYAILLIVAIQKIFFVEAYVKGCGLTPEEEQHHLNDPLIINLHWWEGISNLTISLLLMAAAQLDLKAQRKVIQYGILPNSLMVGYGAHATVRDGHVPNYGAVAPLMGMCTVAFVGGLLVDYGPLKPKALSVEENKSD